MPSSIVLSDNGASSGSAGIKTSGGNDGVLILQTTTSGGTATNAVYVDTSQNVGIGTSSPAYKLDVASTAGTIASLDSTNANGPGLRFTRSGTANGYVGSAKYIVGGALADFGIDVSGANNLIFGTNDIERARIDSSGNLLVAVNSSGSYGGVAATHRVSTGNNSNWSFAVTNTASSGTVYGQTIAYTAQAPNSAGNGFLHCYDNVGARFYVVSNGGIYNYQANDSNLSDRREKTNFAPAGEYLSKICAIPVQTFNYIDQNMAEDPDKTLGVVAQDVQAVAPELVTEFNWGTEEEPKMRLSIYQTDLQYALMKALQELKAELDTAKEQIAILQGAK